MLGPDGTSYTRSGDKIISSRGETYFQRDENTVVGPNGDMYYKNGDTVRGPNGTTIHGVDDDNVFFRKNAEKPKDTWFEDHEHSREEQDARAAKEEDSRKNAIREAQDRIQAEQDRIEREKRMVEMFGKNAPVAIDKDGFYE
jgi:hypothetical protein